MGSKVMSVMDLLGADQIQGMAEKLTLKMEWDLKLFPSAPSGTSSVTPTASFQNFIYLFKAQTVEL